MTAWQLLLRQLTATNMRGVSYFPLKLLWQLRIVHCMLCVHVIVPIVRGSHRFLSAPKFNTLPSMFATGQNSHMYSVQA